MKMFPLAQMGLWKALVALHALEKHVGVAPALLSNLRAN
jgi:hypothetical protein